MFVIVTTDRAINFFINVTSFFSMHQHTPQQHRPCQQTISIFNYTTERFLSLIHESVQISQMDKMSRPSNKLGFSGVQM